MTSFPDVGASCFGAEGGAGVFSLGVEGCGVFDLGAGCGVLSLGGRGACVFSLGIEG